MRRSKALETLRAGKVALGTNISIGPYIMGGALAGKLGLDFTWIDLEHRGYTYQDMTIMIYGCRETDVDAMVRVSDTSAGAFHRCFEMGAAGVMLPHCRSAAEARHAVDCSKFQPVGRRSMENVLVDADFGFADGNEFIEWHNRESFVAVQVEDREAVEVVDQIAATDGVDILFIGPGDLTKAYGKFGNMDAPEYKRAVKRVAQACEQHNKWWGLPTGSAPDGVKRYVGLGARFLAPFSDYGAIRDGWQRQVGEVKEILAKEGCI